MTLLCPGRLLTHDAGLMGISGNENGLKSLPSKTSVGEDGISYRLLQEVGPGVVGPLVSLFNKSISLGSVPTEWKMAVSTPIFKGGVRSSDPCELSSNFTNIMRG